MSELKTLCIKLGVKCFKFKEFWFLHEYCTAMKPLATALDILEDDWPNATLLPTRSDAEDPGCKICLQAFQI